MAKNKGKGCKSSTHPLAGHWKEIERFKLNVGDCREFPSLSGAPQAQQNTSAQQMWANPTLRTTQQNQQNTIGRPQGQGQQLGQGQAAQAANQQQQNQGQDDSSQSQFSGAGDDYRFGGQGGVGQLGGAQPQTGNIEEFPPLGGAGGDIPQDRRAGLIQNAAAFGSNGSSAFPGLGQTRNGLSSPTDSQQDRTINPTVGGRTLPGTGKQEKPAGIAATDGHSITDAV
jgi:CCR4-NOT transcription complex subunit 2